MPRMTQVNVLFPAELLAALRAESERTGAALNELVRRAVAASLAPRHFPDGASR